MTELVKKINKLFSRPNQSKNDLVRDLQKQKKKCFLIFLRSTIFSNKLIVYFQQRKKTFSITLEPSKPHRLVQLATNPTSAEDFFSSTARPGVPPVNVNMALTNLP